MLLLGTYIYSNAFNGVSGITFLCALNSYAAEYALDRQIPIIPTQMDNEEVNGPLNAENSYYIHNYDGLSAAGVLLENKVLAEGVVLERKTKDETLPPAFLRLQDVARDLDALIRRSKGRPNKELAKLADQLRQVMTRWEG